MITWFHCKPFRAPELGLGNRYPYLSETSEHFWWRSFRRSKSIAIILLRYHRFHRRRKVKCRTVTDPSVDSWSQTIALQFKWIFSNLSLYIFLSLSLFIYVSFSRLSLSMSLSLSPAASWFFLSLSFSFLILIFLIFLSFSIPSYSCFSSFLRPIGSKN